jgi:hypothetical protein
MLLSSVAAWLIALTIPHSQAPQEASLKPDSRVLKEQFTISRERYDESKRAYIWVLVAKADIEGTPHFVARFRDADERAIESKDLVFSPAVSNAARGTKFTVTIKYPTRKSMERVESIEVVRNDDFSR